MPFLVVAAETLSKMPIKLLKWPPTDSRMFPADAKRTLEFTWVPKAPSLQECKEMIKKAYGIMSSQSIKIYYHDGFEVVREEDFTFCRKKLENKLYERKISLSVGRNLKIIMPAIQIMLT